MKVKLLNKQYHPENYFWAFAGNRCGWTQLEKMVPAFIESNLNHPQVTLENPLIFSELWDLLHYWLSVEIGFVYHSQAANKYIEKKRTAFWSLFYSHLDNILCKSLIFPWLLFFYLHVGPKTSLLRS